MSEREQVRTWATEQLAELANRLRATVERDGEQSTAVWQWLAAAVAELRERGESW